MKKLFRIIPLLLVLCGNLQAQYIPLVEEGKFWIYRNYQNSDMPRSESGHAITFRGDTIINSLTYKKVYRIGLKGQQDCPPYKQPCWEFDLPYEAESQQLVSFIREDIQARKVYNIPNVNNIFCETDEYLLFDFSLEPGDMLNNCVYQNILAEDTQLYPGGIVDSIKTIEVRGQLRRTLFTYGFYTIVGLPFETKIMIAEGLGFENFGIFLAPLSEFSDYCEGDLGECDLLLSNDAVLVQTDITIFPNPSNGLIKVSSKLGQIKNIKAYSPFGKIRSESHWSSSIDLNGLANGVYVLEIALDNDMKVIRKVVKGN